MMLCAATLGGGRSTAMVAALILSLLLFLVPAQAPGRDVPRLTGRVNDYAGMISSAVRGALEAELAEFERSDSTQLVVVTVPSLDGDILEDFSIRVAESWKIGQKGKDNGIVLLVSRDDRRMRIEVGRGLQGSLTDLQAGRIIDSVIKPRFREGRYDDGFLEGARAIMAATRGEFTAEPTRPAPVSGIEGFLGPLLFSGIPALFFLRRINRKLPVLAGAAGAPLIYLLVLGSGASLPVLALLAFIGALIGLAVAGVRTDGHRGPGSRTGSESWTTFDSSSSWGGSSGGDFSGGGGSFDGGGASGDW